VGEDEPPAADLEDETWPYDPAWVELAKPPLERLRREALEPSPREPTRYPTPAQPTTAT